MQPGEYPQPRARVAQLCFTAVNGYTTARWRNLAVTKLAPEAVKSQLVLQNVGDQTITLQLQEVTNFTVSGGRTNVGSPVTLVPSGFKTVQFTPTKPILEAACTSGTSTVRSQIESLISWEIMASVSILENGGINPYFPPCFDQSADQLPWAQL